MDEIKSLIFEFLPISKDAWMVLSWGLVVEEGNSSMYKVKIVLNRLTEFVEGAKGAYDFGLTKDQIGIVVNLGILRALSPGTVVRNQKIVAFIHDYRNATKAFKLPENLNYKIVTLGASIGSTPKENAFNTPGLMAGIPAIEFIANNERVVIPCSVAADYFFFGHPKQINFILKGEIHRKIHLRNKVYDPRKSDFVPTSQSKVLAYVRLKKDMKDADGFKIARLAYDQFFWNKCAELNANLIKRDHNNRFMECGLPFNGAAELKVYGRRVNAVSGSVYFVYKIVKCNARVPFDALIISRDNPGGPPKESKLGFSNDGNNEKPKTKIGLDNKDKNKEKTVGQSHAQYNRADEELIFPNVEEQNIDANLVLKEDELCGNGEKSERFNYLTQTIGTITYTTEEEKKGGKPIIRIRLSSSWPTNPLQQPPITCFELIENAIMLSEGYLKNKEELIGEFKNRLVCPLPFEGNPYSIFPVYNLKPIDQSLADREKRKFCYMNIKQKRFSILRRVFINELMVNKKCFYIIDVEPKYKRKKTVNEEKVDAGFISGFAVIIQRAEFSKDDAIVFLNDVADAGGQWEKMNLGLYKTFKHTSADKMRRAICSFIETCIGP